jgi:hypothetical protein
MMARDSDRLYPEAVRKACWPSCPGAIWCRRSGCPLRRSASASCPAFACTSSVTARPEEPHPRDADHLRSPVPGQRPVRAWWARAARPLGYPRPVAPQRRRQPGADRRARATDRPADRRAQTPMGPIIATSRCWSPRPGSAGSTPSRSPPRSATSSASPRRPSCAATPASAHASSSPPPPADFRIEARAAATNYSCRQIRPSARSPARTDTLRG